VTAYRPAESTVPTMEYGRNVTICVTLLAKSWNLRYVHFADSHFSQADLDAAMGMALVRITG